MKRTMLYLSLLAVSCSVSAAKYPVLTESSPEKAGFMEQPVKATTGTLYDLASNTKMYATNFALQKLMS